VNIEKKKYEFRTSEGEPHVLVAELVKKAMSTAGPSQGAKAPSGGSAAHAVASVGALFTAPAKVNTIDGVRVDWPDGFGLIRASNTTPVLVLRFEGHTPQALHRIEGEMLALLRSVKPDAAFEKAAH
jgi:phosphomannomutase